jgi:hypothetical protein
MPNIEMGTCRHAPYTHGSTAIAHICVDAWQRFGDFRPYRRLSFGFREAACTSLSSSLLKARVFGSSPTRRRCCNRLLVCCLVDYANPSLVLIAGVVDLHPIT